MCISWYWPALHVTRHTETHNITEWVWFYYCSLFISLSSSRSSPSTKSTYGIFVRLAESNGKRQATAQGIIWSALPFHKLQSLGRSETRQFAVSLNFPVGPTYFTAAMVNFNPSTARWSAEPRFRIAIFVGSRDNVIAARDNAFVFGEAEMGIRIAREFLNMFDWSIHRLLKRT